jgi:hypothetical protein
MAEKTKLVVATPCFGGQVASIYCASLFKLRGALRAYPDIELKLEMQQNDALITRARANLVAAFLDDPAATHLLFIDADIGFEPEQVLRLLASEAEVCAAIYPIKRLDWDKIRETVATGRPEPAAASLHYVLDVEDPRRIATRGEFARVRAAGTGFLMIRRAVLEKMCERYQSLRFSGDHNYRDALAGSQNRVALFECMIDPRSKVYLSEDFSFCRRWTDMGGEIWADLKSRLNHVGPTTYQGNLATQLAGL